MRDLSFLTQSQGLKRLGVVTALLAGGGGIGGGSGMAAVQAQELARVYVGAGGGASVKAPFSFSIRPLRRIVFPKRAPRPVAALAPLSISPSSPFQLGEVYVFPNPAKKGVAPVFHVEAGEADYVDVRVYNLQGEVVHRERAAGPPRLVDDGQGLQWAFEFPWEGSIVSGTYIYVVEAYKSGEEPLKKISKLAVLR